MTECFVILFLSSHNFDCTMKSHGQMEGQAEPLQSTVDLLKPVCLWMVRKPAQARREQMSSTQRGLLQPCHHNFYKRRILLRKSNTHHLPAKSSPHAGKQMKLFILDQLYACRSTITNLYFGVHGPDFKRQKRANESTYKSDSLRMQ